MREAISTFIGCMVAAGMAAYLTLHHVQMECYRASLTDSDRALCEKVFGGKYD